MIRKFRVNLFFLMEISLKVLSKIIFAITVCIGIKMVTLIKAHGKMT